MIALPRADAIICSFIIITLAQVSPRRCNFWDCRGCTISAKTIRPTKYKATGSVITFRELWKSSLKCSIIMTRLKTPIFARDSIVPFADAIVTYYDQHWPRDADGKIRMAPVQSLETYQLDAMNPTPDIAGLKAAIPRLLSLPKI